MTTLRRTGVLTLCLLLASAGSAAAQSGSTTSTTTTKTKTSTSTTGTSWKSPDGTKGGSSSNTTTSTRSQSTTVGRPSTGSQPTLPAPGAAAVQWMAGAWNATDRGGKRCSVQLYANMDSGGGATSNGCQSDINGIGNWALRGNTLMLIKNVFSTAATLQRTGPSRFEGTTASGEPISIWR